MFIAASAAKNEKPIENISDLWRVLDEKMFKQFCDDNLTYAGVGFFKQHAMSLFKSYYDLGLMKDKKVIEALPSFVNSYLVDRFWVPQKVVEEVKVLPCWEPKNWNS